MKKGKNNKKKSPSRRKYEAENPTVSARLPKETRDKLRVNLARADMSLTDSLKVLAGELEVKMKPINEAWKGGFAAGQDCGFKKAKELYAVPYQCCYCHREIVVTTNDEKKAIKGYMHEHRWAHAECQDRMSGG